MVSSLEIRIRPRPALVNNGKEGNLLVYENPGENHIAVVNTKIMPISSLAGCTPRPIHGLIMLETTVVICQLDSIMT